MEAKESNSSWRDQHTVNGRNVLALLRPRQCARHQLAMGSARKGVCSIVALCVDNADNFTSISHCSESMCSNAMGMCSTTTTNESVMMQALSLFHPAPHKEELDTLGRNNVSLGCMHKALQYRPWLLAIAWPLEV